MNKKLIVAIITVVVLAGVMAFWFLPKTYVVTVYSSRYFEACDFFSETAQQECKKLDPPTVIEKKEPFILG